MDLGITFALIGTGMAVSAGAYGSSRGVQVAGEAAAGVLSEKPELFGKLLLMEALPGSQAIYGFLVGLLILVQSGILGGATTLSAELGLTFLAASVPCTISALISGICQGKVAAAGIQAIAKDASNVGKAVILAAMVETMAILGLLVSILAIFSTKVS
jgi:V/A-type H+-transporting ATPase subunit K